MGHLQILVADRNNPKVQEIYFRLLFGLEKLKEYDVALEYMAELARLKPNSMQAKYEAGRMGNAAGEYEQAEDHLRGALALEPMGAEIKYQLALSLFNQGIIDETQ